MRSRRRQWLGAGILAAIAAQLRPLLALASDAQVRPPFVTTPDEVVERMLALARTTADDVVMDLGSGDGRIVIAAARRFGARGIGVEIDAWLVAQSREAARQAGVQGRAAFEEGDVLRANLGRATVITVYLLPSLMNELQPRFLAELRPGTRIVAHAFAMSGWKPDASELMRISRPHSGQGDESRLFLWIVPAQVRGEWRAGDWRLRISQNYQEIEIDAEHSGRALAVKDARLEGALLRFSGESFSYSGRVSGARIMGELRRGAESAPLAFERR